MVLKGNKKVLRAAQKIANQRMRVEVLPLLSLRHPRPNSWNPLRAEFNGPSAYAMKIWLADKLAMEILRTPELLDVTAQIVVESTAAAALAEPKAFVTSILDSLMSD